MKITKVKLFESKSDKYVASGSITLDECFVVSGLVLRNGKNGPFVSMPSKKVGEEYKDICFPVTKQFRQELQDAVINEWNNRAGDSAETAGKPIQYTEPDDDILPF